MGIFKTLTPEEQAARDTERARKERERVEAQWRARQDKEYREFMAGPAGQARQAFERGDHVFQAGFNLLSQEHAVIPMMNAYTLAKASDPTAILNAICREGWELHNSGFSFLHEGEESRDKFLASGQHIATRGKMMGYYVFRRCEQHRVIPEENTDTPVAAAHARREISSKGGIGSLEVF